MNKIYNILSYYLLLLLGLIGTSWLIWSRFLRERVIRNVPDDMLTEYRVWILIYICCIYLYVVKSLVKPNKPNIFISQISKLISKYIWKPLILLDHFLKYNKYCNDYYYKIFTKLIAYWDNFTDIGHGIFMIIFQIIPRIILVIFLFLDTFYFHKIEIFYKLVLIGIIPFLFKYFEYSLKDFYDNLVNQLTDKYSKVHIYEKGYRSDLGRKGKTNAIWHGELVSVEEYIEILFDTYVENIRENTSYNYMGVPYCKQHIFNQYIEKFKKDIPDWTDLESQEVDKLFEDLIPQIFNLKFTLFLFEENKKERKIIWPKIVIFSLYLICWGYILIISYYHYPIELPMFKYFINNIFLYLMVGEDPFMQDLYSLNENLITIKSIKNLILNIIINIINNMKK